MKKLCTIILILLSVQTCCFAAFFKKQPQNFDTSQGYMGTLPDLTKEHKPTEPSVAHPIFDKTSRRSFPGMGAMPAFVNIILKQDKTSPYINDLREFIDMFEQIYESIDTHENVQRFAARVYFLNKNAEYFRDKYSDKPEGSFISFEKVLNFPISSEFRFLPSLIFGR